MQAKVHRSLLQAVALAKCLLVAYNNSLKFQLRVFSGRIASLVAIVIDIRTGRRLVLCRAHYCSPCESGGASYFGKRR